MGKIMFVARYVAELQIGDMISGYPMGYIRHKIIDLKKIDSVNFQLTLDQLGKDNTFKVDLLGVDQVLVQVELKE